MYVCLCKGITDSDIEAAVSEGCHSVRDLKKCFGLGTQCGRCTSHARDVLHDTIHNNFQPVEIHPAAHIDIEVCYT